MFMGPGHGLSRVHARLKARFGACGVVYVGLSPCDGSGGVVRPLLQPFWLVPVSRARRPATLVVATWWLLSRFPATVVRRLVSGADETAGLSPRNLGVGSHDCLLGYHHLAIPVAKSKAPGSLTFSNVGCRTNEHDSASLCIRSPPGCPPLPAPASHSTPPTPQVRRRCCGHRRERVLRGQTAGQTDCQSHHAKWSSWVLCPSRSSLQISHEKHGSWRWGRQSHFLHHQQGDDVSEPTATAPTQEEKRRPRQRPKATTRESSRWSTRAWRRTTPWRTPTDPLWKATCRFHLL